MQSFLNQLKAIMPHPQYGNLASASKNVALSEMTSFIPSLNKGGNYAEKFVSFCTSLLTVTTSIGIGIMFNPQRSLADSSYCVGVFSTNSGGNIGFLNTINNSYTTILNYGATSTNINGAAVQPGTGNIYFVDRNSGRLAYYNTATNVVTAVPITGTGLPGAATLVGATFASTGELYLFYGSSRQIAQINPATGALVGNVLNIAGLPTAGALNGDIAIDPNGQVYVIGDPATAPILYKLTIGATSASVDTGVAITGLTTASNGLAIDPVSGRFFVSTSQGTHRLNTSVFPHQADLSSSNLGTDLASCGSPVPNKPTIVKQFSPETVVGLPATSQLTLTLGNSNLVPIYLTQALTDTLPTGLVVATPNGLSTTCKDSLSSATTPVTATAGANSIVLSNGSKIPVGGCTISVNVRANNPGTYINTIAAEGLKTIAGNNTDPTTSTLVVPGIDYGDAPITGTAPNGISTNAYGQAIHGVISGIRLGAVIDAETASIANATASGDGADDDGISSFPTLTAGANSYSIPAANITATGTGTLHAWIDFNKNGTFDAGEYTSVAVTNNTLTGDLNWTGITTGAVGNTFARFRLTSDTTLAASTPSGTADDGEVEDYQVPIAISGTNISGTVFEDPNYGGGTGRNLATPTTSPRDGAIVELYKSDGTYVSSTTTSGGGKYTFTGIVAGDYKVRVVNSTVTSSRPGYVAGLLPVQTFRTDATTGTVTDVTDHVGGEKPQEVDAPANTTANLSTLDTATQEVQSLTTVKVGTTAVTGVDFGYNFDTIVNTNNAGQGSVRQFITNSNSLTNAGLNQQGLTPGKETSIFMISDGNTHPGLRAGIASGINGTGGNTNAAVISLTSNFSITDADTQLDATTQTTNVGNLNTGTVGTGGTVGVDGLALSTIPKPEVVFDLRSVPTNTNAILVKGGNTVLKGFASYGYRTTGNLSTLFKAAIVVDAVVPDASRATITQLLGGTMADGSDPAVPTIDVGYTLQTAGAVDISNNYFAYNSDAITFENTNGTSVNFIDNELAYNGPKNNNGSNGSGIYADQMETVQGTKNITLRGNLVRNSTKPGYANAQGQGIQISYSSFITLENNTFTDNNVYAINASSSDTLIRKNIVAGTKNTGLGQGSGIIVYYGGPLNTGLRNRITQNSIYQNAKLGIDHQVDGVTPNDGTISAAQPNNGIDYPIVTSSLLNGNDLTVKGYVGNVATGSSTFANVTLEFFIADDDGNNNGKVFSTDPATVSKPHGEGKTYIGTCTANGNSLFDCTFANVNNLMPSGQAFDPKNITATATDAVGNTSEFSSMPMANNPNVLLVKRITAINNSTITFGGDSLAGYIDELTNPYDDNTITITTQTLPTDPPRDTDKWPTLNSFMLGGINGGNIKPNDEVEYTIYFLSTGLGEAKNVLFCDRVPNNVTFLPTAFKGQTAAPGGLGGGDRGILSLLNGTTTAYSNVADGDAARYFAPGEDPQSIFPNLNCGGPNTNGAVVVNLGDLPNATTPANPIGSYGFVRFRGRVK
jgi:trimeric autotransporter adhesin